MYVNERMAGAEGGMGAILLLHSHAHYVYICLHVYINTTMKGRKKEVPHLSMYVLYVCGAYCLCS